MQIFILSAITDSDNKHGKMIMNELSSSWTEAEKQLYLTALEYVLNLDSDDNPTKKEFMKNKARELGCPLSKLKKVRSSAELTKLLMPIPSVRTKRCLLRDMILLAAADHDLSDKAIGEIYEIGIKIGIKAEKIDDFFLWAARGLEWQVDGSRLIDEDI